MGPKGPKDPKDTKVQKAQKGPNAPTHPKGSGPIRRKRLKKPKRPKAQQAKFDTLLTPKNLIFVVSKTFVFKSERKAGRCKSQAISPLKKGGFSKSQKGFIFMTVEVAKSLNNEPKPWWLFAKLFNHNLMANVFFL